MPGEERQPKGQPPRRAIEEGEVTLARAAFLMAHLACDKAVEFTRGEGPVLCRRGRRNDPRSFEVAAGGARRRFSGRVQLYLGLTYSQPGGEAQLAGFVRLRPW